MFRVTARRLPLKQGREAWSASMTIWACPYPDRIIPLRPWFAGFKAAVSSHDERVRFSPRAPTMPPCADHGRYVIR